jgi:hypothetical protein
MLLNVPLCATLRPNVGCGVLSGAGSTAVAGTQRVSPGKSSIQK